MLKSYCNLAIKNIFYIYIDRYMSECVHTHAYSIDWKTYYIYWSEKEPWSLDAFDSEEKMLVDTQQSSYAACFPLCLRLPFDGLAWPKNVSAS